MGPVVSPKQKDRVLGYLRRGVEEGASALLPGGEAGNPRVQGRILREACPADRLLLRMCARGKRFSVRWLT